MLFESWLRPLGRTFLVLGVSAGLVAVGSGLKPALAQDEAAAPSTTAEELNQSIFDAPAFQQAIHDYIMENPEVILDSIEVYNERQRIIAEQQANKAMTEHQKVIMKDPHVGRAGDPDGEIVMIEFFDYHCGYCKRARADVARLLKEDDLQVIFVDTPILSDNSRLAARWSLAAQELDKYWEFHQELLRHRGNYSEAAMEDMAKEAGMDPDKLAEAAGQDKWDEIITGYVEMAQEMGIRGTPSFIVDGELFRGAVGYDKLKEAVHNARLTK